MVVGMTMCSSDPSFTLTWQPERNRQKYSCCGVVALGSSFSTLACCLLSGVAALARVVHGHAASPATQVERKASKRVSLSKAHPHPHMCEPTVVGCNGYLYTKETQDRKYHQDMKDGEGKPLVAAYRGQGISRLQCVVSCNCQTFAKLSHHFSAQVTCARSQPRAPSSRVTVCTHLASPAEPKSR